MAPTSLFHQSSAASVTSKRNSTTLIHFVPKWQPINYFFVCMLISLLRLDNMYKKQKNFEVKMKRRRLINIKTKE